LGEDHVDVAGVGHLAGLAVVEFVELFGDRLLIGEEEEGLIGVLKGVKVCYRSYNVVTVADLSVCLVLAEDVCLEELL
jgi:hypothetical protein